jgi:lysyl-tRNA synthetase class 2
MVAVESRAISRIGYDPETKCLLVTFRSGEAYAYSDVPAAIFAAFRDAESHGRFFQAHIRDHYVFCRMPPPPRRWRPWGRKAYA